MADHDGRWNHNIHYQSVVRAAIPPGCRSALDVGCGEGVLTRELATVVPSVTGIDPHGPTLDLARAATGDTAGVEYVQGDVLTHDLAPASFDLVASISVLHHMDTAAGLTRMRELLRPGGVLAVVGIPRPQRPRDLPYDLAGSVLHRWYRRRRNYQEILAPTVWPPPDTFDQVRSAAQRLLPGVGMRRHAMWRYSLVWTKPAR